MRATEGMDHPGRLVSLTEFKTAIHAAAFLRGTFHDPPWLKDIIVEVAESGAVYIVVLLTTNDTMLARCIPTAVNHVPVVKRVVG
jgi:hypothetical protein